MRHCEDDYVVQTNPGAEDTSVGLMQINLQTAEDTCPQMDVFKLEDNVECGIKVLQEKYDIARNDDEYERLVNENCDPESNPEANQKYLGYTNDWNQALRGYNGFGCNEGADLDYVEKVRGEMG